MTKGELSRLFKELPYYNSPYGGINRSRILNAAKKEYKEEPMSQYYNKLIAGYPSRLRVKLILEELGEMYRANVLDIGCEEGYVAWQIFDNNVCKVYGIDIVKEALKSFRKKIKERRVRNSVFAVHSYFQKMPFPDNFFDAVVCTEVIEHTNDLKKGFKEIQRVMKPGAKLILTFPNEKLRRKVYWIPKMFGVNTDVEDEVTLYEREIEDVKKQLPQGLSTKRSYRFPWYFQITNMMIIQKDGNRRIRKKIEVV